MTDQPQDAAPEQAPPPEPEQLTLREFQADDIDGLFFLEQRCYEGALAMSYQQLRALLKDPGVATLVLVGKVEDAPRMVAALTVKPEAEQGRLMIVSLNVDPDYRRLGLARQLAERARRAAAQLKLAAVAMPVEAENAPGAAFLKAVGFEPAEDAKPYFTGPEDGTLWRLAVESPPETP